MRKYFLILFLSIAGSAFSQDLHNARRTVNQLTSKALWGRGYTNNGMAKAANFICSAFKAYGLSPMSGADFKQPFSFPVNTFPGKMLVTINGKKLSPGKDYIVMPQSIGKTAKGKFVQKDSVTFADTDQRIITVLKDKLTWSVAPQQGDFTGIEINKNAIKGIPLNFQINIENAFIPEFNTSNICGIVKGTTKPDSLLVITAHYDHLGGMGGKTYFPGANDNASGISFLLSLAKYYAANPQPYTMAFICFAGEEAGLLGSKYFTDHPLLPLQKIRFLVNVDMVGTGETGITVVNATIHPKEFSLLNQLNDKSKYLPKINPRGKAANSDHYFFTEKNIPAFFIYTTGGISAYHDIYDRPKTLPLTEYQDLFKLFIDFNAALMK
ncbi:aminopeptidase [Pedobacter ginsengisoli]|uniref:Aminopeptidase n=1 Tax=Pedobacter ginsengisoli TaxID=363852 RepID=A0A2D1U9F3_9SPHI|nr:M28 family peptidase [Pedobacter ginsengisoli]ATP58249.1 aminopeptidase [Pedobacter ginsengisoli]